MGGYPSSAVNSPTNSIESHNNNHYNIKIEKITEIKSHEESVIKLLLLGMPACGKSTLLKQFRILYGKSWSHEEMKEYVPVIRRNITISMQCLIKETRELKTYRKIKNTQALQIIECTDPYSPWTVEYGGHIKELWNDDKIQDAYHSIYVFKYYHDAYATKYFIDRSDIISVPWYQPVPQDLLVCRLKTSGNPIERFDIQGMHFQIVDVGGQTSERTKWTNHYDSINTVIYLINLSEYDLPSAENPKINALVRSLEIFEKLCNSTQLPNNVSIVLFFNMRDLFQMKLAKKSINSIPDFSDFTGDATNYTEGVQYFINKFIDKVVNSKVPNRKTFHHTTCAIDTASISIILNVVKDSILRTLM